MQTCSRASSYAAMGHSSPAPPKAEGRGSEGKRVIPPISGRPGFRELVTASSLVAWNPPSPLHIHLCPFLPQPVRNRPHTTSRGFRGYGTHHPGAQGRAKYRPRQPGRRRGRGTTRRPVGVFPCRLHPPPLQSRCCTQPSPQGVLSVGWQLAAVVKPCMRNAVTLTRQCNCSTDTASRKRHATMPCL